MQQLRDAPARRIRLGDSHEIMVEASYRKLVPPQPLAIELIATRPISTVRSAAVKSGSTYIPAARAECPLIEANSVQTSSEFKSLQCFIPTETLSRVIPWFELDTPLFSRAVYSRDLFFLREHSLQKS